MKKWLRSIVLFPFNILMGITSTNAPATETGPTIRNVAGVNDAEGNTLGKSITTPVSLYGVTPITQRASASQAAVVTTLAISTTSAKWGFATSTQANDLVTLTNELRAALVALGAIKGSV